MKNVGTITILAIDLHNKRVALDVSAVKKGTFSLPQQARKQRAEIALNGDLFSFATGKPSGLQRRRGKNRPGTKRTSESGIFAFERSRLGKPGRTGILPGSRKLPKWANNAVSGRPVIVRNGKVVKNHPAWDRPRLERKTGRSAVGLSRSGRILYLAAATGIGTKHMARMLARNGIDDALALDGSGSSQMYVKGKGMVKPGDGRRVGNAILVHSS